MAVVIGIERPHERSAQTPIPIRIPDAEISREGIIVSYVAVASVALQHVRNERDRIVISLPAIFIDPLLHPRSVVHGLHGSIIAFAVSRSRRIRTEPEKPVDVGVMVAVERSPHVELHRGNMLQENVDCLLRTSAGLT